MRRDSDGFQRCNLLLTSLVYIIKLEVLSMASLNKVMLIGNLGKDPEIRQTTSGQSVASFSLATSEKYKNKSGEWEERTEWHNVILWAKLAEIARDYLAKGKTVYIEGRVQTRKWQDTSGNDRYTTEIVGENMQLLTPKDSGEPPPDDPFPF